MVINKKDLIIAGIAKEWVSQMKQSHSTTDKVAAIHAIIKSLFTEGELEKHLTFIEKGKKEHLVKNNPRYMQTLVALFKVTHHLLQIKRCQKP